MLFLKNKMTQIIKYFFTNLCLKEKKLSVTSKLKNLINLLFHSVLILSLTLPSYYVKAQGQDYSIRQQSKVLSLMGPLTKEHQKAFDDVYQFEQEISKLREAFENGSQDGQHPYDTFHLLSQGVVDLRKELVEVEKSKVQREDAREKRVSEVKFLKNLFLKDPKMGLEYIGKSNLIKAIKLVQLRSNNLQVDHQVLSESLNNLDLNQIQGEDLLKITNFDIGLVLEAAVDNVEVASLLGVIPENVEDFVDTYTSQRRLAPHRLQLYFFNESSELKGKLSYSEMIGSTSHKFNKQMFSAQTNGIDTSENLYLKIFSNKGEVLHEFYRPILSAGFWGHYLVFLEKETIQKEKDIYYLRFINLDYFKGSIGNSPLPVYSFPIKASQPPQNIEVNEGQLVIGESKLTIESVNFLSELFQVIFNLSVSMTDPRTISSSELLVSQLASLFDQSLGHQSDLTQVLLNEAAGSTDVLKNLVVESEKSINFQASLVKNKSSLESAEVVSSLLETEGDRLNYSPLLSEIKDAHKNNERLASVNQNVMISRKFLSRFHMLMSRLVHPQPLGAPKLIQAMAMTAEGLFKRDWDEIKISHQELNSHPLYKYGKYGAGALGAAVLGTMLPEPYALQLSQSLDLIEMMVTHLHGYLGQMGYGANFGDLLSQSTQTVISSGVQFDDQYISDDRLGKSGVLLASMTVILTAVFAVPHFLSNTFQAYNSLNKKKGHFQKYRELGLSRWGAFKKMFIEYEQRRRRVYDITRAKAEKKNSGAQVTFTEAEDKVANLIAEELKKNVTDGIMDFRREKKSLFDKNQSPMLSSSALGLSLVSIDPNMTNSLSNNNTCVNSVCDAVTDSMDSLLVDMKTSSESTKKIEEQLNKKGIVIKNIDTFGKAIRQFAMSYPSLTTTFKTLAFIWNYCFISRSFALKPKTWFMALIYPKYFRVASSTNPRRVHPPTLFNGGKANRIFYNQIESRYGEGSLKALEKFEKEILPVETIAYEISLEKSLVALLKYSVDPSSFLNLFDSTQLPKTGLLNSHILEGEIAPSSGIGSVSDKKLKRLSSQQRAFFQHYLSKMMNETVAAFIKERIVGVGHDATVVENADAKDIKRLAAKDVATNLYLHYEQNIQKSGLSEKGLKDLKEHLLQLSLNVEKAGLFDESKSVAEDMSKFMVRKAHAIEYDLYRALSPNSPQMSRFLLSENQLNKFKAVMRAVRSEIASFVVDTPMRLFTVLFLYAGISDGSMFQPLHDEMFGPNSFFHGSRHLFFNEFVLGTFIGVMANTWFKVQTDARIDSLGGFSKVPLEKDLKGGFWRYYFKNAFKNPTNKWLDNQVYLGNLIWANIPAAFVTFLVLQGIALGRFDVGLFLSGYIIMYLTPLMGIGQKIEQAYELAASWVAGQIPVKLRAHPEIQNYIEKDSQKKRLIFSIGHGIYSSVTGVVADLFGMMDHPEHGKRAFLKMLFYGYQPEEIISQALQKVVKYGGWIPGVETVASACESWITNNNTALDPDKLMPRK